MKVKNLQKDSVLD